MGWVVTVMRLLELELEFEMEWGSVRNLAQREETRQGSKHTGR
jgi:hypothetical protein